MEIQGSSKAQRARGSAGAAEAGARAGSARASIVPSKGRAPAWLATSSARPGEGTSGRPPPLPATSARRGTRTAAPKHIGEGLVVAPLVVRVVALEPAQPPVGAPRAHRAGGPSAPRPNRLRKLHASLESLAQQAHEGDGGAHAAPGAEGASGGGSCGWRGCAAVPVARGCSCGRRPRPAARCAIPARVRAQSCTAASRREARPEARPPRTSRVMSTPRPWRRSRRKSSESGAIPARRAAAVDAGRTAAPASGQRRPARQPASCASGRSCPRPPRSPLRAPGRATAAAQRVEPVALVHDLEPRVEARGGSGTPAATGSG